MKNRISINNTLLLKGIGILLIALHNYFHWMTNACVENEFDFSIGNFYGFINGITKTNSLSYILSFFGHYGVQFFIFLSGYGLATGYGKEKIEYWSFIKKRLFKIYPVFTLAILLLLAYEHIISLLISNFPIYYGDFITMYMEINAEKWWRVFIRYTLIANFIPKEIFTLSGPYWFYSMIVQLYLLFPFFIFCHRKSPVALWLIFGVSYLIIFFIKPYFSSMEISLFNNFMGNIPVFVLGMLFALNKKIKVNGWIWLIAVIIFFVGQINENIWCFTQISFVLITIPIILKAYNWRSNSPVAKFLIYTGQLSMYIFAVNGFLRRPWIWYANEEQSQLYTYVYAIVFIVIVFLVSIFLRKLEVYLLSKIRKT